MRRLGSRRMGVRRAACRSHSATVRCTCGSDRRRRSGWGEAGIVDDQHGVSLGPHGEPLADARVIERRLVPDQLAHQVVELLLVDPGQDLGHGVAVLVRDLGQEPRTVALQEPGARGLGEVHAQGGEKLGELGERPLRRAGQTRRHATATQATRTPRRRKIVSLTKQY